MLEWTYKWIVRRWKCMGIKYTACMVSHYHPGATRDGRVNVYDDKHLNIRVWPGEEHVEIREKLPGKVEVVVFNRDYGGMQAFREGCWTDHLTSLFPEAQHMSRVVYLQEQKEKRERWTPVDDCAQYPQENS